MRTSKNRKIFSANNEQGTRIFTLGLHYSCIPSYNNIVKIFSNRPAVAGLIKKSPATAELIKKSPRFIISRKYFFRFSKSAPTPRYTNQKVQLQLD